MGNSPYLISYYYALLLMQQLLRRVIFPATLKGEEAP
jgi:hypothetical protein